MFSAEIENPHFPLTSQSHIFIQNPRFDFPILQFKCVQPKKNFWGKSISSVLKSLFFYS